VETRALRETFSDHQAPIHKYDQYDFNISEQNDSKKQLYFERFPEILAKIQSIFH
jgi:hypothetical protein